MWYHCSLRDMEDGDREAAQLQGQENAEAETDESEEEEASDVVVGFCCVLLVVALMCCNHLKWHIPHLPDFWT